MFCSNRTSQQGGPGGPGEEARERGALAPHEVDGGAGARVAVRPEVGRPGVEDELALPEPRVFPLAEARAEQVGREGRGPLRPARAQVGKRASKSWMVLK